MRSRGRLPGGHWRVAIAGGHEQADVLLVGGPPCQPFSRAGRNKIRHRILNGFADPSEERRHLWRSFLEIVMIAQPAAVLMENVPDMALDKDKLGQDLQKAFDDAKNNAWSTQQVAQALAAAIDAYATAADVTNVRTDVNGNQIQNGKLQ